MKIETPRASARGVLHQLRCVAGIFLTHIEQFVPRYPPPSEVEVNLLARTVRFFLPSLINPIRRDATGRHDPEDLFTALLSGKNTLLSISIINCFLYIRSMLLLGKNGQLSDACCSVRAPARIFFVVHNTPQRTMCLLLWYSKQKPLARGGWVDRPK